MVVVTGHTPASPRTRAKEVGRRTRRHGRAGATAAYALLFMVVALLFLPVVWVVICSLKNNAELWQYPPIVFPREVVWRNYRIVLTYRLTSSTFPIAAARSLFLCVINCVPLVISSAFAGYGFARIDAPGREALFVLVLSLMMVPGIVITIPMYVLYSKFGLINTYWPWLLWGLSGSPFYIFLFRQFYRGFATELEDAAMIDGCHRMRIFWQIFLPNSTPLLAAGLVMSSLGVWGDYFTPALFLSDARAPLAVLLASAACDPNVHNRCISMVTPTLAGIVIWALPLVVAYLWAQRYLVQMNLSVGIKA